MEVDKIYNNNSLFIFQELLHINSSNPPKLPDRCETSLSISSSVFDQCRICQCDVSEIEESSPLIAPCLCMGTMKFVHQACLQKWIKSSDKSSCELCKYVYKMSTKVKPFNKVREFCYYFAHTVEPLRGLSCAC